MLFHNSKLIVGREVGAAFSRALVGSMLAALAASGCADEGIGDGEGADEPTVATQVSSLALLKGDAWAEPALQGTDELTSVGGYTEATWYKGQPYKELISTSQGFCFLAGVQGQFNDGNDQASVFITGGKYGLTGSNTEWAKAICVDWSALKINFNAFEPVRWLSDEFYAISGCNSKYADTWFGDAVTYLTGVGGDLTTPGGSFVIQSEQGSKPSQLLSTHTCGQGTEVFTRGRSMFFGKPHINDMPQFWGPKGQGKTFPNAGYYYVQSNTQASVEMAPTNQAFCYLMGVNGNYNQANDWAWITTKTNSAGQKVWKLQVSDAGSTNGQFVGATAGCYMLSQN
jgi:hypothetical protein